MKTKKTIKKSKTIVLILLVFCICPLVAEPCGDVNSNGEINIIDALLIAQYYVGDDPKPFDRCAADVSGDCDINIIDALMLAQYYVAKINILPGCEKQIDDNWTWRIKLTFTNSSQAEDLIDFPVLITLDDNRINYNQTQNAGQDIRFVDPNGRLLSHEIEEWNEAGTSCVWVKVPKIDGGSDTDYIWMYYGNPNAPDGQVPVSVWASDYRMVYHLAGTSSTIPDSTANKFTGTNDGTTPAIGFIAGARDFDNRQYNYIDLGRDLAVINGVEVATLSAWIRPDDLEGRGDIIAISIGGSISDYSRASIYQYDDEAGVIAKAPDSQNMHLIDTTSGSLTLNWHYVVGVIDYAGNAVTIYVDGVSQPLSDSPGFDAPVTDDTNSAIAALGSEDDACCYFFDGRIDEVRVAATGRSADWITAQYASMTDNFITYGSEEDTLAAGR